MHLGRSVMRWQRLALMFIFATIMCRSARAADVQVDVHQAVVQNFVTVLGTVGVSGGGSTSIPIPYLGWCKVWDWIYVPCIKWTSCTAAYSWSVSISTL